MCLHLDPRVQHRLLAHKALYTMGGSEALCGKEMPGIAARPQSRKWKRSNVDKKNRNRWLEPEWIHAAERRIQCGLGAWKPSNRRLTHCDSDALTATEFAGNVTNACNPSPVLCLTPSPSPLISLHDYSSRSLDLRLHESHRLTIHRSQSFSRPLALAGFASACPSVTVGSYPSECGNK